MRNIVMRFTHKFQNLLDQFNNISIEKANDFKENINTYKFTLLEQLDQKNLNLKAQLSQLQNLTSDY